MGKTAFSGPAYGGKSYLFGFGPQLGASQASTAVAFLNSVRVVPPYEDWYLTEWHLTTSTNSSAAQSFKLKSEGGSTTIPARPNVGSTIAQTLFTVSGAGSTTISTNGVFSATAGEFEGAWVPAGSTVRLVSSGGSAPANVHLQVMGYIRYIDSTRSA